jgi:hypothetical protein
MKIKYAILLLGLCFAHNLFAQADENQVEMVVQLDNKADKATITQFFQEIKAKGMQISDVKIKKQMGKIRKLAFHLAHEDGLDHKFKAIGFEQFEIKLLLNGEGKAVSFAVRFNEKGDFSKPASLESHGRSSYVFKSTGSTADVYVY